MLPLPPVDIVRKQPIISHHDEKILYAPEWPNQYASTIRNTDSKEANGQNLICIVSYHLLRTIQRNYISKTGT